MPTYFHVAPTAARGQIAAEGLLVQGADYYEEQTPGVYAWESDRAARRCQREYERLGEAPFDVWSFGSAALADDPLCPGGVFSTEPIPSGRVRLYLRASWKDED